VLVQSEPTLFLETPLYSVGSDCNSLRLYSLSYSLSPRCSNSLSPRCSYSRSPRLYSLSPLYIPSLDSSHTGSCTSIVSSHYYPLLASPTPAPTTSQLAEFRFFFRKRGTSFFADRPPRSSYRPRRVESKGSDGIPRQPITSHFVGYPTFAVRPCG
jgi:hypothetical protein